MFEHLKRGAESLAKLSDSDCSFDVLVMVRHKQRGASDKVHVVATEDWLASVQHGNLPLSKHQLTMVSVDTE